MQPREVLNISKHGTVPETMMRTRTIELWNIFKVGVTRETNLLVSAMDLLFLFLRGVCSMLLTSNLTYKDITLEKISKLSYA